MQYTDEYEAVESGVVEMKNLETPELVVVPLDSLVNHPRNYKKHPPKQIAKLKADILRFGQVKPIVIQVGPVGNLIIAGHGFIKAVRELVAIGEVAMHNISAIKVPLHWTTEDVLGYMVADNETGRDAETDDTILAELLDEQRNSGHDLASVGFTDQELDALLENLGSQLLDLFPGDNEDLLDITDASPSVEALKQLKFGKYLIQMTDEEFDALSKRLEAYATETGSHFGFVGSLLNV